MKRILMLGAALMLAGCARMPIPLLGGGSTVVYSNPQAGQMRGCADGIDVFTPGVSLQAIPGLIRGSAASLGGTAEEGMEKCLRMLRLDESARRWETATDELAVGHALGEPEYLVRKIDPAELVAVEG